MRYFVVACLFIFSCRGHLYPVNQRGMDFGGRAVVRSGKPSLGSGSGSELYIERQHPKITDSPNKNFSGSLFANPEFEANIYSTNIPHLGSYVEVEIQSEKTHSKQSKLQENIEDESESVDSEDPVELGKGFKKTKLQMKVVSRTRRGDIVIEYRRDSKNSLARNTLRVSGKIPESKVFKGEVFQVGDLVDVSWLESKNGEITESSSTSWTKSYSDRLLGFTEALSREGLTIEAEKKRLKNKEKTLRQQLSNVGKERRTISKERERIAKEKGSITERMAGYEKKIEEQGEKIESQRNELRTLKNNPADERENSDGA